MNLYNSIEETKENNNKKFNDMKENVCLSNYVDPYNTKATRRRFAKERNSP